jgi:hypothetical protein
MADYLLRNSLNPSKVIRCTITFRQLVNKGEDGELVWLVEINTPEPHKDGGSIPPVYIHYTSSQNLDAAIKEATEDIAKQVDWSPLREDLRPPFVFYNSPSEPNEVVDLFSNVVVDIKDILPAAGIDPDSIKMTVNGMDVSDELQITGDPYQYRVIWDTSIRVRDYY